MPARTTPTRRAASSSRSRSGSTASRKRAPAKRPSAGSRKPPAKKKSSSGGAGLFRIVGGGWGLLARGVGGLARSVARPEEAEPLAPEHRRDGVGLAVLGLAVVLGAAVWSDGIGPVGEAIAGGTRWVVGSLVLVLPVLLLFVALRLLRRPPAPESRGRLVVG
jgi:DNA segregation ATPase FtsK/SpoIIIE, S-DNA-T family